MLADRASRDGFGLCRSDFQSKLRGEMPAIFVIGMVAVVAVGSWSASSGRCWAKEGLSLKMWKVASKLYSEKWRRGGSWTGCFDVPRSPSPRPSPSGRGGAAVRPSALEGFEDLGRAYEALACADLVASFS